MASISRDRHYKRWTRMLERAAREGYGVAPEWRDFANFKRWLLDNGVQRGMSLYPDDPTLPIGPDNACLTTRNTAPGKASGDAKPVEMLGDDGGTIAVFGSISEAERQTGASYYAISVAVNNPARTAAGHRWRRYRG